MTASWLAQQERALGAQLRNGPRAAAQGWESAIFQVRPRGSSDAWARPFVQKVCTGLPCPWHQPLLLPKLRSHKARPPRWGPEQLTPHGSSRSWRPRGQEPRLAPKSSVPLLEASGHHSGERLCFSDSLFKTELLSPSLLISVCSVCTTSITHQAAGQPTLDAA